MTPQQRIACVLKSRGLEATAEQVDGWIGKMHSRFQAKHSMQVMRDSFADSLADAIEDGQKTWTMCLHVEFGDSLAKS